MSTSNLSIFVVHFSGSSIVGIESFAEGLAAVRFTLLTPWDPKDGKYGYINKKGEWAIQPQFESARDFSEAFAAVQLIRDDKWGYIDRSGNVAIPIQFDEVENFCNGIALVKMSNHYGFINTKGEVVIPVKYSEDQLKSTPSLISGSLISGLVPVKMQPSEHTSNSNTYHTQPSKIEESTEGRIASTAGVASSTNYSSKQMPPNNPSRSGDRSYVKDDTENPQISSLCTQFKINLRGRLWDERIKYNYVCFTPDESSLAISGVSKVNGDVILFADASTGRIEQEIHNPHEQTEMLSSFGLSRITFSPDGQLMATGSDGLVKLWQLKPVKELIALPFKKKPTTSIGWGREYGGEIYSLLFSKDGKSLFAGGGIDSSPPIYGIVKGWNIESYNEIFAIEPEGRVRSLFFLPDERSIVGVTDLGTVKTWHPNTGIMQTSSLKIPKERVWKLALSGNGTVLADVIGSDSLEESVFKIEVLNASNGTKLSTISEKAKLVQMMLSPDGRILITGRDGMFTAGGRVIPDSSIRFWDTKTGQLLAELEDLRGYIQSLSLAPNNKIIAVAIYDPTRWQDYPGSVFVWDINYDNSALSGVKTESGNDDHLGGRAVNNYQYVKNKGETKVADFDHTIAQKTGQQPNVQSRTSPKEIPGYPVDAVEFGGHHYKVFWEILPWNQAKMTCTQMGGHLVCIETDQEKQFLAKLKGQGKAVWVGGHRVGSNTWEWINGKPLARSELKEQYPPADHNCVAFHASSGLNARPDNGHVDSFPIKDIQGFICEWDN